MVIEYTVRAGDSLRRIAAEYGTTYEALAAYNGLAWPFLVDTPQPGTAATPASGLVAFTWPAPLAAAATVDTTCTVGAALTATTLLRQYTVAETFTVPSGATTVTMTVVCTEPGTFGNVAATAINQLVVGGGLPAGTTVTNPAALTNGTNATLLLPGQTLYIPTSLTLPSDTFALPKSTPFGGVDLLLDFATGDLVVDARGDLALAYGLDNIAINLQAALQTTRGDLVMHPTYGLAALETIVTNTPERDKLLALEVAETLLADPDVAAVDNVDTTVAGTALTIASEVILRNAQQLTVGSVLTGGALGG